VVLQLSYTRNAIASQGMVEEGIPVIQKPFSTTELADRVRAVLVR
jgi:DNA-binding response OmpR family regulator